MLPRIGKGAYNGHVPSTKEKLMRFTKLVVSFAFLFAFLLGANRLFAQSSDTGLAKAGSPQGLPMMFFAAKKKMADADVQKCFEGKLSGGALKDDGITVKVNNGEAVLEGKSKVPGHKGTASQISKGCGAQKVTNNIIITRNPKPPKD
jgi:osmotically-inducible protein OsmY